MTHDSSYTVFTGP